MKVVSEMLGHTTTAITQDVYAHVLPTMQADAVRKLDAVLRRGASQAVRSTRRLSIVSLSAIATAVAFKGSDKGSAWICGPLA